LKPGGKRERYAIHKFREEERREKYRSDIKKGLEKYPHTIHKESEKTSKKELMGAANEILQMEERKVKE
jgi:hypothetical protein